VSEKKPEEKAVQVVASRQGIDPDVLALVTSVLQEDEDETAKTVSTIATAGEALSKASPQVAQPLGQLLGAALIKQLNTDPVQQRIVSLVSAIAAAKSLLGGDETTKVLMEQLNRLQERIQEMAEAKNREEINKILDDTTAILSKMQEKIESLERRIEELKTAPAQQTPPPKEPLDDVMSYAEQLTKMKTAIQTIAEALGVKVVKPGAEEIDAESIERVKKKLGELGFEVRPRTMTVDEYRRRLKLIEKKLRAKYEKKLRESEKMKELEARKLENYTAVALRFLGLLENVLGGRSSSGDLLKQLIGAEQQAGQGGAVSGAGGAVQQAQ
jgi:polyhydroxyalkanoate synthesis regulator phasin